MNILSGVRNSPNITLPAEQSGAMHQTRLPSSTKHLDLVLISIAEGFADEHPLFAKAKYAGLSFEAILVDEPDGRDLPAKIAALHANAVLGAGTQVVILMHGGIRDGRHVLGTSVKISIDTCELINALRYPPGSSKPVSQWKGVIHLISCHIAAVGEGMRDRLGYCVLYGGHENTLCVDGLDTVTEMMRVFGRSKQEDGSAINASHLFPHLASFTGEPITLTGNGRCDLIHPFDAALAAFDGEKSETDRWMRILFSRLDHGTSAEVQRILEIMGPQLVNTLHAGTRALHIAAGSLDEGCEKISSLMIAGADIHGIDDEGCSALTDACLFGNAKLVACLLAYGADPLAPDTNGATPLEHAFVEGDKEILRLLLGHFLDGINSVHIDEFLALAKKTSARSVVQRLREVFNQ